MKQTSYLFPDTEKVGGIIFHYSRRINGSFVKAAKENLNIAIEKLKRYKNVNLKSLMDVTPIHIYIYPDIKSFKSAFGYQMQKIETKQMHFMMSKNIEARYILTDEFGNVHMVLPVGRSTSTYTTFSAELVSIIVEQYIDLNEKQRYELKNAVKGYIVAHNEKEEKAKKEAEERELEEAEEKEKQEEEEKERQDAEEKERQEEEERLQKELEEQEEQRAETLASLTALDEEELQEVVDTQNELENIKEVPNWLVYGWRGYICGRLDNPVNAKRFKTLIDKNKIPKPTKLDSNISSELDLDVAIAAVQYIVTTYGYRAYIRLCEQPDNIKGIFYGATTLNNDEAKKRFNDEVRQYIFQEYNRVSIKEVIEFDSDNVPEVVYKLPTVENKVKL